MSSWPDRDNKAVRGPIDSSYVSLTEPWELNHFIDAYLASRSYEVSAENRRKVAADLQQCPLQAPIRRIDLAAWLDRLYGRTS